MDGLIQYLKRLYIRLKYYRYGWRGNYLSWSAAEALCGGYNASNILDKVKAAALAVKEGRAVYERDALLSDKIEYSWPLLAHLLWIASINDNHLAVLDFGGSLGSSYFQNRHYLHQLKKVTWSIVEQPAFVAAGKKDFAGTSLDFFESVNEAIQKKGSHTVLLLSCVLPYLEKPYELLQELAAIEIPYIIIENTYFNKRPGDRLTIQKVPPVYYDAAYPAWFLDYEKTIAVLEAKYELNTAFTNDQFLYLEGEKIMYRGFLMQLKT